MRISDWSSDVCSSDLCFFGVGFASRWVRSFSVASTVGSAAFLLAFAMKSLNVVDDLPMRESVTWSGIVFRRNWRRKGWSPVYLTLEDSVKYALWKRSNFVSISASWPGTSAGVDRKSVV